jgi:predicted GH43/DUF377 family glycosyl hydrolase
MNRREFTALGAMALTARAWAECGNGRLATPYKLGRLVLKGSGEEGAYDKIFVDCPYVFQHDGRFYMTFVAYDGVGYQTGLASSANLVDWKKEGAILRRDPSSEIRRYNVAMNWILRENELHAPGRLKRVGGEFLGVYHAYPNNGLESGAAIIGLTRSRDLRHWECSEPILRAEDGAAWEHGGLYKPCLVEYEGTYYLFYNAKDKTDGSWHEQSGVATSKDLKKWTRYEGNPILRNGGAGAMDENFASDPCVLKNGSEWAFFYFGLDAKYAARDLVATGPDLFHPAKCPGALIDVGPKGSVDSQFAHKPSMIAWKGDLYHLMNIKLAPAWQ